MEKNINPEQMVKLITNGTTGVLCLHGSETGYPFPLPVSYVYYKNAIYMISDKNGEKIDWIRQNPKAVFVIIRKDKPAPQYFTIEYESIIAKGTAEIIEDPAIVAEISQTFVQRFFSQFLHRSAHYMEQVMRDCVVIRLNIEEMTGKSKDTD